MENLVAWVENLSTLEILVLVVLASLILDLLKWLLHKPVSRLLVVPITLIGLVFSLGTVASYAS